MCRLFLILLAALFIARPGHSADAPRISGFQIHQGQSRIQLLPHPGTDAYQMLRAPTLSSPFVPDSSGTIAGYDWTAPWTGEASGFYKLQIVPVPLRTVTALTALNRLAYGPTPEDLRRVLTLGPEGFIEEQLQPETIVENLGLDQTQPPGEWQFYSMTGSGSSSSLYIYLTVAGAAYIDDLRLVAGTIAEAGPNLLRNGDFELPLHANDWTISPNHSASSLSTTVQRSGNASLHLVASARGTTRGSSIWQNIQPALSSSRQYTLSFWYRAEPGSKSPVTVRLSGNGIVAASGSLFGNLQDGTATIEELQRWHLLRAIQSRRQLLEVLLQFSDNHFTTFYTKSRDYIDGRISARLEGFIATEFEFRELQKWREVLLNPNGTFYDLLRISAESPTMIIYLDTATSRRGAANENYSRELMELFTMGVDNGYDQADIEEMSRAWTGWRVDKLPPGQETNPFAARVSNRDLDPGYWTLQFRSGDHDTGAKRLFPGRKVDARFGPPHAGRSYELVLPARSGNAGMQDGYDILSHLADLPYTMEYISVKLCQLFVHDEFHHALYDYTSPQASPEALLIRSCMQAWDTPAADGRKGNLRSVLRVIFESDLFQSHSASRQKVKTPMEFVISSVRALRVERPSGSVTADTNGSDLLSPMRALNMRLFYREDPDGWPEVGRDWINTSSLVERMRFVQTLLRNRSTDPVALLRMNLPEGQWSDAGAVVDYFLNLLFLGEGRANLDLDRTAALAFLNSNDTGNLNSSPFRNLNPASSAYDLRVRSMAAFLMGLPRFQEQ